MSIEAYSKLMILFQSLIALYDYLHISTDDNWFFKILSIRLLIIEFLSYAILKWFVEVEIVMGKLFLDWMWVYFLKIVISGLGHDLHAFKITLKTGMNRSSGSITSDYNILTGGASTFMFLYILRIYWVR